METPDSPTTTNPSPPGISETTCSDPTDNQTGNSIPNPSCEISQDEFGPPPPVPRRVSFPPASPSTPNPIAQTDEPTLDIKVSNQSENEVIDQNDPIVSIQPQNSDISPIPIEAINPKPISDNNQLFTLPETNEDTPVGSTSEYNTKSSSENDKSSPVEENPIPAPQDSQPIDSSPPQENEKPDQDTSVSEHLLVDMDVDKQIDKIHCENSAEDTLQSQLTPDLQSQPIYESLDHGEGDSDSDSDEDNDYSDISRLSQNLSSSQSLQLDVTRALKDLKVIRRQSTLHMSITSSQMSSFSNSQNLDDINTAQIITSSDDDDDDVENHTVESVSKDSLKISSDPKKSILEPLSELEPQPVSESCTESSSESSSESPSESPSESLQNQQNSSTSSEKPTNNQSSVQCKNRIIGSISIKSLNVSAVPSNESSKDESQLPKESTPGVLGIISTPENFRQSLTRPTAHISINSSKHIKIVSIPSNGAQNQHVETTRDLPPIPSDTTIDTSLDTPSTKPIPSHILSNSNNSSVQSSNVTDEPSKNVSSTQETTSSSIPSIPTPIPEPTTHSKVPKTLPVDLKITKPLVQSTSPPSKKIILPETKPAQLMKSPRRPLPPIHQHPVVQEKSPPIISPRSRRPPPDAILKDIPPPVQKQPPKVHPSTTVPNSSPKTIDSQDEKVNSQPEKPQLSESERKKMMRDQVAKEILSTEQKYVRSLQVIVSHFMTNFESSGVLNPQEVNLLFSNVKSILGINKKFFTELLKVIDAWDDIPVEKQCIGQIFLDLIPYLKMYKVYLKNFNMVLQKLPTFMQRGQFSALLERLEAAPDCGGLKFTSFLIMPVQRLPRYQLLLKELIKRTESTHPDFGLLEEALKQVTSVNFQVNEAVRERENIQAILEIQSRFSNKAPVLIKPGRFFKKEGFLVKMCRKAPKPRVFFLFTDILLYAVPTTGTSKIRYSRTIDLANCHLKGIQDTPTYKNAFQIINKSKSFTVIADSLDIKNQWMNETQAMIDEIHKKRASLAQQESSQFKENLLHSKFRKQIKTNPENQQSLEHAPVWTPDKFVKDCQRCHLKFGIRKRRHHCRHCGFLVCHPCSINKLALSHLESGSRPVRICNECYKNITGAISSETPIKRKKLTKEAKKAAKMQTLAAQALRSPGTQMLPTTAPRLTRKLSLRKKPVTIGATTAADGTPVLPEPLDISAYIEAKQQIEESNSPTPRSFIQTKNHPELVSDKPKKVSSYSPDSNPQSRTGPLVDLDKKLDLSSAPTPPPSKPKIKPKNRVPSNIDFSSAPTPPPSKPIVKKKPRIPSNIDFASAPTPPPFKEKSGGETPPGTRKRKAPVPQRTSKSRISKRKPLPVAPDSPTFAAKSATIEIEPKAKLTKNSSSPSKPKKLKPVPTRPPRSKTSVSDTATSKELPQIVSPRNKFGTKSTTVRRRKRTGTRRRPTATRKVLRRTLVKKNTSRTPRKVPAVAHSTKTAPPVPSKTRAPTKRSTQSVTSSSSSSSTVKSPSKPVVRKRKVAPKPRATPVSPSKSSAKTVSQVSHVPRATILNGRTSTKEFERAPPPSGVRRRDRRGRPNKRPC